MSRSRTGGGRLLDVFLLAVDELGIQKTNKALRVEIKKKKSLTNSDAFFIVSAVAELLEISVEEIYRGTGRKNDRRYAIGFCAYYLHYIFKYPMDEVCYMLRKQNEWTVYKYSLSIKCLNPNHASDQPYIEIKELLDKRVQEHKKQRNKKKSTNEKANRA